MKLPSEKRERTVAVATVGAVGAMVVAASVMAPTPSHGATTPTDDSVELVRVPVRTVKPRQQAALRRAAPAHLAVALDTIQAEIEFSRASGDPRPLGRAQGLLDPWLSRPEPPARILMLAATVAQSLHRFEEALGLLERAVAADPRDPQGWLTRASVLTVRGRYQEARASCQPLAELTSTSVLLACIAQVEGVTGQAEAARHTLERALSVSRTVAEQNWLRSLHAELVYWTGERAQAQRELAQVLAKDPHDRYTRMLYADLLLDEGKAEQVLALLTGQEEDDAMLLRLSLASLRLDSPDGAARAKRLEERFQEARLRGDFVHQREEGRLLLALPNQAARALKSAQENFHVQKEPWDARLLLEAALRAKTPEAARPALEWMRTTGFESQVLRELAAQLRETP